MTPAEVRVRRTCRAWATETDQLYVNAATIPLGAIPKRVATLEEGIGQLPPGQSLPDASPRAGAGAGEAGRPDVRQLRRGRQDVQSGLVPPL
jgi:hypothetical protein